jgi:ankyrin repeat protein
LLISFINLYNSKLSFKMESILNDTSLLWSDRITDEVVSADKEGWTIVGVNIRDRYGRSCLEIAIDKNDADFVKFVLDQGADVNYIPARGLTHFHHACESGNLEIVKLISTLCNAEHCTLVYIWIKPIECAAYNGFVKIVQYLHEELKLNLYDSLLWAARDGWIDVVEYLLSVVELNLDNPYNPLRMACAHGKIDVVERMLEKNVNLASFRKHDRTYIIIAASSGHLDIIKMLVNYGDDYRFVDSKGMTALHYACDNGHVDVVEFLIGLGVNVSCTNLEGETALDLTRNEKIRALFK